MNVDSNFMINPLPGVSLIKELTVNWSIPFKVNEFVVKPRNKTPLDQHEVAELWYIIHGKGELLYQDTVHILKTGDWFFFYPHEKHQVENTSHSELKILSLYW